MKNTASRMLPGLMALTLVIALGACSNMNNTQQRTLSGAAIGAGAGAAVGAVTGGCVSCGAAIGTAAGAAGGYIYDQTKK